MCALLRERGAAQSDNSLTKHKQPAGAGECPAGQPKRATKGVQGHLTVKSHTLVLELSVEELLPDQPLSRRRRRRERERAGELSVKTHPRVRDGHQRRERRGGLFGKGELVKRVEAFSRGGRREALYIYIYICIFF